MESRSFLLGLSGILASGSSPAIIRNAGILMPVRKIITLERSRILDEYVGDVHGLTIFIDAYVPERAGNVHPKLAYEDFDYRGNPILRQYKYHYET